MNIVDILFEEDDIEEAITSSLFDDSESSNTDEEFEFARKLLEKKKQKTRKGALLKDFNILSDGEFTKKFRISRAKVFELIQGYRQSEMNKRLMCKSIVHFDVSEEEAILIFLTLAGSYEKSCDDITIQFGISRQDVMKVISSVCQYINNMADRFLNWPSYNEQNNSKSYYSQKGFPNVIGCIGNSLINRTKDEDYDYVSSKEYFQFVVQGVCNEQYKFIDIFVDYTDSLKSSIFKNSPLCKRLIETSNLDYCLISGSNYANSSHIISPYESSSAPLTEKQLFFNKKLLECCLDINHAFDLLKKRFLQLHHIQLEEPLIITTFIKACCVLHNLADIEDHEHFENEECTDGRPTVNELKIDTVNHSLLTFRNEICENMYKLRNVNKNSS